jgi:hypothetical protein
MRAVDLHHLSKTTLPLPPLPVGSGFSPFVGDLGLSQPQTGSLWVDRDPGQGSHFFTRQSRTKIRVVVRKNTLAAKRAIVATLAKRKAENVDQSESSIPFAAIPEGTPILV